MRPLERYKVLRSLGRGAAGGVFLVEDRILGGPPVALKRIHARADDLLRTSFEREFVALASLSLPGIARVLDFGLAEAGEGDPGGPFFTRTYVEGEPLDDAARALSAADRIRLVARVCDVVAPLHRIGVVHGDLKPANVVVASDARPHVIDFGLARLPGERGGRGGVGSPAFMAPELLRGGQPSIAADVYALGGTLWLLLTGEAPHEKAGALPGRLAGILPAIPDDSDDVTRRALEVALRALAPDPLERLPAALELAALLRELAPDDAARATRDPLVPPRPRAHEALLGRLETAARARRPGEPREAQVVIGPRGAGKSTLLREVKWRLQVSGVRVIEAPASGSDGLAPLRAIARQASALSSSDGDDASRAEPSAPTAAAVADRLALAAQRGPVAVLVDDVDSADPLVATALRMALHGDGGDRLAVIVTTARDDAPSVVEIGAQSPIDLPALAEHDVAEIAAEALGPIDPSVSKALYKHTRGVPGAVMEALASLAPAGAVTVGDVQALPAGAVGRAAARAQLAAVDGDARRVVEALAVADVPLPRAWLAPAASVDAAAIERSVGAGLVSESGDAVALLDRSVGDVVRDALGAAEVKRRAAAMLARNDGLPLAAQARLAIVAGAEREGRDVLVAAAREHAGAGANATAAQLLEAARPHVTGDARRDLALDLARLYQALGRYDDAASAARETLADASASADRRAHAAVAVARALVALSKSDDAVSVLDGVPEGSAPAVRALALRERAKIELRRGDYDAAAAACARGLELAPEGDPARIELLTSAGMVASYRGDRERAKESYDEALRLAREAGSRRDEANVLTYVAIDCQRAGELKKARDLYAESLAIARELGDVGSMATFALNLGAVSFSLGEHARAAEHYESAGRLARRAGRASTDVMARNNLANLHVYLGLYERARIGAEGASRDAETAGLKLAAAQATALLGDVAARMGDVDRALRFYDDAIARYRALGQKREVAEALLDAAEALLDRDGPVDGSAAAARLAEARATIEADGVDEFRPRLRLLLAMARASAGDLDGAASELEAVAADAKQRVDRELEWRALAEAGRIQYMRGAEFVARRHDLAAVEVLESIAMGLPREARESFWHDPRRREVRRRASAGASTGAPADAGRRAAVLPRSTGSMEGTFHGAGLETRVARLLELIKRLASEHELDRLLERITDSAVELSGAERGFVLLTDEKGQLEPRTVRRAGNTDDPSVAFSQSIAEAVLIDGEPIITVDASDDRRLSEYLSVHKLMLKSVACLPIRGREGVAGVLYLEHRMRRGRFEESDVDLLFAFADQAAIALENARLLAENERRREELETANQKLEAAKAEIERLLVARTAELETTKRELDRARDELRTAYDRHGIVGRSAAMRRVFAVVDRVRDADVPVVIQGESGTGKELVARAIHYGGARAKKPFIAINCAAIPEALLESELFGHVRGAFTGADRDRRGVLVQASGGTLFLDEVGDMPAKMQVDLLRVLQDGKVRPVGGDKEEAVDVRIIAASNKLLRDLVKQNKFREDLFYRLNVVEIALPPLRDRADDVPLLVDHFLARYAKEHGGAPKRLAREALERLAAHPLPGNVRQLEHLLLNACVMVEGEVIEPDDLALDDVAANDLRAAERARIAVAAADGGGVRAAAAASDRELPSSFEDFKKTEKQRILEALEVHGWNRVRAAKALGMPRRTFYRRLKEHDIL